MNRQENRNVRKRSITNILIYLVLATAFLFYTIRVILRDIIQPISEIPQFFESFDDSELFQEIMMI